MINQGTVPTKIDCVLSHGFPQCSPCLGPGSTTVSSRRRPVRPAFTTVKPGSVPVHACDIPVHADGVPVHAVGVPVHAGGVPVHPGAAMVTAGTATVLEMFSIRTNSDSKVVNREVTGVTGANRGPPFAKPNCLDGVPVHPG